MPLRCGADGRIRMPRKKSGRPKGGFATAVSSGDFALQYVPSYTKPAESLFSLAPTDVSVKIKMTFGSGKKTITKNHTLKGTAAQVLAQLNKLKA